MGLLPLSDYTTLKQVKCENMHPRGGFVQRKSALFCCCVFVALLLLVNQVPWNHRLPQQPPQQRLAAPLEYNAKMGSGSSQDKLQCLTDSAEFIVSMTQQKQGLLIAKHDNGSLNVDETWRMIPAYFNKIWSPFYELLNVVALPSGDENKYFVPFVEKEPQSCNFITLGVGGINVAERKLREMYPLCSILGVDPTARRNEALFREIGAQFIEAAVSGKSAQAQPVEVWKETASVQMQNLIGIMDFLANQTADPIDLLMMDVEGHEFSILEQFVDAQEKLPKTICQLNMELHTPHCMFKNNTYEAFFDYFNVWISQGRYALVHADMLPMGAHFLRLFLVNVADEGCRRKFLCRGH